jgi:hypothetical protein
MKKKPSPKQTRPPGYYMVGRYDMGCEPVIVRLLGVVNGREMIKHHATRAVIESMREYPNNWWWEAMFIPDYLPDKL